MRRCIPNSKAQTDQCAYHVCPHWSRPFKCHIDASQLAVENTFKPMSNDGEHAISYFSKRLSPAEKNHTANDRELLELVYFLQRCRCYLEEANFEVLTDNRVLLNFFTKPELSRREERRLGFLGSFGINKKSLINGKVHVLGDALSRAPHITANNAESSLLEHTLVIDLPHGMTDAYGDDQFFSCFFQAFQGQLPNSSVQKDRILRLLPEFKMSGEVLKYQEKVCIPRR